MHINESSHATQLFVLRIWLEEIGNGRSEWRVQLQQVGSGEVRYFRDWQMLIACLVEMLTQPENRA